MLPQGVFIGKDGTVGASFGGYSASAGLGGIVGNGGTKGNLHAEAGTPHGHYAAAGLGGSLSENSGSNGHLYSNAGHVNRIGGGQPSPPAAQSNSQGFPNGGVVNYGNTRPQGSGTFDDIFNIPIAALGAVNKYLNNRHRGKGE
ncbi:hypothetical protein RUM44_011778 [Polyplax serrata]|uniref:Uncharacterized protein n=1 Tax=Polyplax serrata TaxID=468196 RepID=A0ABR1AR96_POLSC